MAEQRLPKPDWRILQRRMHAVSVVSCTDGTMIVTPKWRRSWTQNSIGPGIFTRMGSAGELERLINKSIESAGELERLINQRLKVKHP